MDSIKFSINGHPVEFWLVNEGDALCLMADGFYVLSIERDGKAVSYSDGANKLNHLRGDESGYLILTRSCDVEEV